MAGKDCVAIASDRRLGVQLVCTTRKDSSTLSIHCKLSRMATALEALSLTMLLFPSVALVSFLWRDRSNSLSVVIDDSGDGCTASVQNE